MAIKYNIDEDGDGLIRVYNNKVCNWFNIKINGHIIQMLHHSGELNRPAWHNLGFNAGNQFKDKNFIQALLQNKIPFEYNPNGSFPRIRIPIEYFGHLNSMILNDKTKKYELG